MDAAALSGLLLDIYRYSRTLTIREFQGRTLARLREDLPFDTAWWGVAHRSHDIHSSFPFGLPEDYDRFYLDRVADTDTLAEAGIAQLGRTVRFGPSEFAKSPGLSRLTQTFGIEQALCVVLGTPTQNLVMFISLYRNRREPVYEAQEREFCDWVAPHLWATWSANWIAGIEQIRSDRSAAAASHAIADQRAIVHRAEPRFLELMRLEWPQWRGPALPPPLREALAARREYLGRNLSLRFSQICGLTLVEGRSLTALDRLSPREKTIAHAFGAGRSYKQIAADLGLSPATVRHHLRRIYTKTQISRKSELTWLVR